MKNYLAIDIGTTNWKAAIFNEEGKLVGIEKTQTITHVDVNGYNYYEPKELWEQISGLCKKVTLKVGGSISAVSVTSMAESVVAIDKYGEPIGDIISWFDSRSYMEAREIRDIFGAEKIYAITGLDINPIFSLPKIMWIRKNTPIIYENAEKWLQMSDYIIYMLSGVIATDYTLASRTLAFDITKNKWSKEILNRIGISISTFPEIYESGTVVGTVDKKISEKTGITLGAKIVVGGNDHPCASISAGVLSGRKILDSSGTAESIIYISKKNYVPNMTFDGLRTCRYLQKDRVALWGGIICSGRSGDWAYENLVGSKDFKDVDKGFSYSKTLEIVEKSKGVEKGLLFLPHLRGSGAPYWDADQRGAFVGLKDNVTSADMVKSVFEGLSYQVRMIVERQEKVSGLKADALCVVGGSSKNLVWQQIKANIIQKPIEICEQSEATALGAAMLAAIGNGRYNNIEEVSCILAKHNKIIEPDLTQKDMYEQFYDIFEKAYTSLEIINKIISDSLRK